MPSICPARTEVILHSGRVLIVASLRPAVRTKKGFRTNSARNSGARGTWNTGVFVGGNTYERTILQTFLAGEGEHRAS